MAWQPQKHLRVLPQPKETLSEGKIVIAKSNFYKYVHRVVTVCFKLFVILGFGTAHAQLAFNRPQTLDDLFATVAKQVPEFGGMFFGKNEQTLQVYLTDVSPSTVATVKMAIAAVFGNEIIPEHRIKPRQGRYGFLQLKEWHDRMVGPVLSIPGVTYTDIDEAKNQLGIGIKTRMVKSRVVEQLGRLGIPRTAVAFQVTGPVTPVSTVRSSVSPRQGGYRITRLQCNKPGYSITKGTLGFNAVSLSISGNQPGFVINSHMTAALWNLAV
jgi:hypothetical protein